VRAFTRTVRWLLAGVEDGVFDLGGHSLLAAVLVARLTQQLGVKVSLKTFMSNPCVRGASIGGVSRTDQPRALVTLARRAAQPEGAAASASCEREDAAGS